MTDAGNDDTELALATTDDGTAGGEDAPRGLEYHRLKARMRARLFGGGDEPVRIGRFTVLRRIGEGGMGVVYSAYDDELERKVAIKLVRPELGGDEAQRRIRREAQAAARLSHPNVVAVHEIGAHDGQVFVAMEFVRGRTLRRWLAAERRSWQSIVDAFVAAGHGLQAAHAAGLVHRDFKPDNVMIDDAPQAGRVRARVLDFGVARAVDDGVLELAATVDGRDGVTGPGTSAPLTRAGAIVGTPEFMAPEQLAGEPADARSDQFAWCLALWLALFDASPFGADDADRRTRARARAAGPVHPPPRSTGVPARLRQLLERGLAARPADRHPSMDSLLAQVEALRHRPRRFGVAASLLLTGAVGLAAWRLRPTSACDDGETQLTASWGAGQREAMRTQLRRTAGSGAADLWLELEPALDDYAHAWQAAFAHACRSDDGLDEDARLQRRRCLGSRATAFRAALDGIAGAEVSAMQAALDDVRAWPPADACLDAGALQRWAERDALQHAAAPVGSADGLVSDFEDDIAVRFGFGWVRSTDALVEGDSTASIRVVDGGAHDHDHALEVDAEVREHGGPTWAGAMYFPGAAAMQPANLEGMPKLSFAARGTPGRYVVVLFTQAKRWDGADLQFELDASWRPIAIDLREFGVPLFDVTGVFIGRVEPGTFTFRLDDVRLDATAAMKP